MLPHNYNRKLGYYQLGNEEYAFGIEAVLAGRGRDEFVEFKFNNEFFSRVKWQVEPDQSIQQLYAERARQLRERYDYLILSYSGGSDAWNILNAFLTNNIKLDEVVVYAPLEATKNKTIDPLNFDFANQWQEYHLVIKHDLQYLATHHPEIKISLSDFSEDSDKIVLRDGWQETNQSNLTIQLTNKYYPPNLTDSWKKFKNIGFMIGIEKPKICFRDGKFYIYFLDFVVGLVNDPESSKNNFFSTEYFYWAPESEKILRKQAHLVKQFFQKNPQFMPYITWPQKNVRNGQLYDAIIKPLIYPDWDLTKWQVDKPNEDSFHNGYETPILSVNSKIATDIFYGRKELLKTVDQKYLRTENKLQGFVSGFYEI